MKKPTLKSIAADLGLSRTTVSLVLQNKGNFHRIGKKTQKTIIEYAKTVGYQPNYFAQTLNSCKSQIIGALFPDVFESFMGSLIRGIDSILYDRGYSLMIYTSHFNPLREQHILQEMIYKGVEGIILVPSMPYKKESPYDSSCVQTIIQQQIPIVLVDRNIPELSLPCVVQDDYGLSFSAVSGFIKQGVQRIVCLSFDLQASSIINRLQGYSDAMDDANLIKEFLLLEEQNEDAQDLKIYCQRVFNSDTPPEAFFVTTTLIADKLHFILRSQGITIPIARFGKTSPYSIHSNIIEIEQPHRKMGEMSAHLLLKIIEDKEYAKQELFPIVCE